MPNAPSCCPTTVKPSDFADSSYQPKGNWVSDYVVVGPSPKKRSVLFLVDIFGFHPETLKFADKIAEQANVRVYVPEFFEKSPVNPTGPWPMDGVIGEDERWPAFYEYVTSPKTYARVVAAAQKIKDQDGVAPLAIGFCWGAKMISNLAAQDLVAGCSCVHPSAFKEDDAVNTKVPFAVFPSKDENKEEMDKIKAKLAERDLLGGWIEFMDLHHGFAAARYDPKDPKCEAGRDAVIAATVEFFNKNQIE